MSGPRGRRDAALSHGPFGAVVLAAGAARRFGGGKLLAAWRGRPLIERALETAWAAPVAEVVLVAGADTRVGPAGLALAQGRPLRVVHAPGHAEGMGASLRAGLDALPSGLVGAFVILGDMPAVPLEVLGTLARAVRAGAQAAAPVHEGQRGHPVLLGAGLLARRAELGGDVGAKPLLAGLGGAVAEVPAGPGVLFDVDRPEDIKRGPSVGHWVPPRLGRTGVPRSR